MCIWKPEWENAIFTCELFLYLIIELLHKVEHKKILHVCILDIKVHIKKKGLNLLFFVHGRVRKVSTECYWDFTLSYTVTDTFEAVLSFPKTQEIPTHLSADTQTTAVRSADEKEAWKEYRWDVYVS